VFRVPGCGNGLAAAMNINIKPFMFKEEHMVSFVDFEEINAWRSAKKLTYDIYQTTNQGAISKDYFLKDQLRRSTTSVMANIAKGFGRNGTNEFIYFLAIAKGSIGEVGSLLFVALDQGYIDQTKFHILTKSAREIGLLIGGLISCLQKSRLKGTKYK
jgi:four helix bundle protein